MHQEHTIPWNKLASNYRFIRDNPHFTPRVTGLWLRQRPSQQQDLDYFARVLAQTIRTFADTERKKYDAEPKLPAGGLLFSDELRERYGPGNGDQYRFYGAPNKVHQKLDFWEQDTYIYEWSNPPRLVYSDGNLADVVEVLLIENELLPLFLLGRNPKTPIDCLITATDQAWNVRFSQFIYWSLLTYILINLSTAMDVIDDGRYLETAVYKRLVSSMEGGKCYPGIRRIFEQYLGPVERDPVWNLPMLHKDYPRLREYMKTSFAFLYKYDVVLRECGVDPDWESEIRNIFHSFDGRANELLGCLSKFC